MLDLYTAKVHDTSLWVRGFKNWQEQLSNAKESISLNNDLHIDSWFDHLDTLK